MATVLREIQRSALLFLGCLFLMIALGCFAAIWWMA